MDNLLIENVTATKCVMCGDLLTDWEDTYCIMCEPDEYEVGQGEPYSYLPYGFNSIGIIFRK